MKDTDAGVAPVAQGTFASCCTARSGPSAESPSPSIAREVQDQGEGGHGGPLRLQFHSPIGPSLTSCCLPVPEHQEGHHSSRRTTPTTPFRTRAWQTGAGGHHCDVSPCPIAFGGSSECPMRDPMPTLWGRYGRACAGGAVVDR